jgi:hypothetical protein
VRKRRIFPAAVFLFLGVSSWADSGITTSTDMNFSITSVPEVMLEVNREFVFPMFRGTGSLTADNNLTLTLTGDITPVSMNGAVSLTLTPVAFFQAIGGARLGSGWNVPGLADGMGLNVRQSVVPLGAAGPNGRIDGTPFDGMVWRVWGAGLFRFDLAAVVPGDWNHVVFQTRQEFNYRAYTRAKSGESWLYETDDERLNCWNYYGTYVLGYQMPFSPVLDMVALMAEMDVRLYDMPGSDKWGEHIPRLTLSSIYNFKITERVGTAFIVQLRTYRNFTNYPRLPEDLGDGEERDALYYRDRNLDARNPLSLKFYRVAAIVTVKL